MVNLDYINPQTVGVFQLMSAQAELEGFTLIGGTALALQAGHRNSLDLDFVLLKGSVLPVAKIKRLLHALTLNGHSAKLVQDAAKASAFRINFGIPLESRVMDAVVDGVKVQFFTKPDWPGNLRQALSERTEPIDNCSFEILNLQGLSLTKTLVLADRVKSRDLYDLLWFLEEGILTISDMEQITRLYDPSSIFDTYTDKLTGAIPVDSDDEGLDATGMSCTIEEVQNALAEFVDDYERRTAAEFFDTH